jgi:nicotinamidase-related amidase
VVSCGSDVPHERTEHNDFLSEGGKLWPKVEVVATSVNLIANLQAVVAAVRNAGIQVVATRLETVVQG